MGLAMNSIFLRFTFISCIIIAFISSCCSGYGGPSSNEKYYKRQLKLIDTTDRILRIWYKDANLSSKPNSIATELTLSTNFNTVFYFESKKNGIDTVEVATDYEIEIKTIKCTEYNAEKSQIKFSIYKSSCSEIYFMTAGSYQFLYVK
jgi:hypothetical protein